MRECIIPTGNRLWANPLDAVKFDLVDVSAVLCESESACADIGRTGRRAAPPARAGALCAIFWRENSNIQFSSLDCRYYFSNGIIFRSIWQANNNHLLIKSAHHSLICDGLCFQLHDVCDGSIFRRRLNSCGLVSLFYPHGGIGAFFISSKSLWRSFEFWMEYRIFVYDINGLFLQVGGVFIFENVAYI